MEQSRNLTPRGNHHYLGLVYLAEMIYTGHTLVWKFSNQKFFKYQLVIFSKGFYSQQQISLIVTTDIMLYFVSKLQTKYIFLMIKRPRFTKAFMRGK